MMRPAECQQAVFEVALVLARQDKRLADLASAISLPGDFDPDILPSTVEFELYSRIQAVKADYLQPTVAILMEAAQLSEVALRLKFAQARVSSTDNPRGGGPRGGGGFRGGGSHRDRGSHRGGGSRGARRPRFSDSAVARRVNELMAEKSKPLPAAAFSDTLRECVARRTAELLSMEEEK